VGGRGEPPRERANALNAHRAHKAAQGLEQAISTLAHKHFFATTFSAVKTAATVFAKQLEAVTDLT
jgi:hypothetical protein